MADKLSVQNALTQLLKENKSILKNGQTLIDALFERTDMSFVDRKIYEKAFVDANIGEIFLIETMETANEQAYSKLKRIMQERRALDVLETLSTAINNANNSKQGEDAAETGTNDKQGEDGGQDGANGQEEVPTDTEPPHPPPVLTPNDYYNNGVKAIGEEKFSEAMAAFNKAIELSPTHEKAYGMRAMLHAKNGEYNDAIADYGKVISYNSNNSSAYRNRGMCYYALKDYKAALADFEKVLQLTPDDLEIIEIKRTVTGITDPPPPPPPPPPEPSEGFMKKFFSTSGRVNRSDFFLRELAIIVFISVLICICSVLKMGFISASILFIAIMLGIVSFTSLAIRRMQDCNIFGLWILPFYFFYFIIIVVESSESKYKEPTISILIAVLTLGYLHFKDGTNGPNKYDQGNL